METETEDPGLELIKRQIARAKALATVHLECRTGGLAHAWQLVTPDWSPGRGIRAVAQQCMRCRTVKRYECSTKYGLLLAPPTYQYPRDYLLRRTGESDEPLMSTNAVRAELSRRAKGQVLPDMVPVDDDD